MKTILLNIPDNYKYLAKSSDSSWTVFEIKPIMFNTNWISDKGKTRFLGYFKTPKIDWRDSLKDFSSYNKIELNLEI